MSSKSLLQNLKTNTYCRLKTSKVHGVGVFAIKDIPKGVNPFIRLGKEPSPVKITIREFNTLHPSVQKMIKDYCQKEGDNWYVPDTGFNGIDISFYINNNKHPNVKICCDRTNDLFVYFTALKLIKEGEELFIDYAK